MSLTNKARRYICHTHRYNKKSRKCWSLQIFKKSEFTKKIDKCVGEGKNLLFTQIQKQIVIKMSIKAEEGSNMVSDSHMLVSKKIYSQNVKVITSLQLSQGTQCPKRLVNFSSCTIKRFIILLP